MILFPNSSKFFIGWSTTEILERMKEKYFLKMQIRVFDWLTNHKVVEKYEMICDWWANR